jgi:hypothetical protein
MQHTGRASYLAVDPNNGAVAAWLNGCDNLGPERYTKTVTIFSVWVDGSSVPVSWKVYEFGANQTIDRGICDRTALASKGPSGSDKKDNGYPPDLGPFTAHGISGCEYKGVPGTVGRISCPGVRIVCTKDKREGQSTECLLFQSLPSRTYPVISCRW